MTTFFIAFFAFGACFGLATWSHRHLFSEGHASPGEAGRDDGLGSRIVWLASCCCLWPLLLLSGLYTAGYRARQRVRSRRVNRP